MTGQIYPVCPRSDCFVWSPHKHEAGREGTAILVAPIAPK